MTPVPVRVWIDPSCPWVWQAHRWLHDLTQQGEIELDYAFFSLELNASEDRASFEGAAPRYGRALTALAFARREGGSPAVTALYVALGSRLHERKREMDDGLLLEAAHEAGLPDLAGAPDLGDALIEEFHAARALDVFGVPTLQVPQTKTMYGPILAVGPTGEDGLALWHAVVALLERDVFFELKRWPRDVRPGGLPTGPGP
jgi:predicted DsbA family dithiol-disulfide isomerase